MIVIIQIFFFSQPNDHDGYGDDNDISYLIISFLSLWHLVMAEIQDSGLLLQPGDNEQIYDDDDNASLVISFAVTNDDYVLIPQILYSFLFSWNC